MSLKDVTKKSLDWVNNDLNKDWGGRTVTQDAVG